MIFVERVGRCPTAWTEPDQILRIVDLHNNSRGHGFYCVGGTPDEDGPTHRVEDRPDGHTIVTVYGPPWLQDGDVEDWRDWTDSVASREEVVA